MDSPRLTVKEIARLAGVSIGTVDRVLHDRGGVSSGTKGKIEEIIESNGYEPNLLARHLSLNKTFVFRVVLPLAAQDSGYWSLCLSGIRRAARDVAPYGVRVRIDEVDRYDRAAYRELLREIAAEPGDGLLFAPFLPDELVPALEKIEGRVPYAFFDGSIEGAKPMAVVAQDAFRGGFLAGRVMSLLVGAGRALLAVGVHAEVRHIGRRIEGFRAFFGAEGRSRGPAARIREVHCTALEKEGDCDEVLAAAFAEDPDMAGVLVANSAGHLVGDWLERAGFRGAARRRRGPSPEVALVSWDLVPANASALEEGRIDCVLSQRPADQGREALERLVRAVINRSPDDSWIAVPLEVYFKENLPPAEDGETEPGRGSPARQEAR